MPAPAGGVVAEAGSLSYSYSFPPSSPFPNYHRRTKLLHGSTCCCSSSSLLLRSPLVSPGLPSTTVSTSTHPEAPAWPRRVPAPVGVGTPDPASARLDLRQRPAAASSAPAPPHGLTPVAPYPSDLFISFPPFGFRINAV
ncbi:hypothetical protein BS78_05G071800 [Paspalum vaginatum]|nr:hypothetical protein BS78_05G071800 [Paspalum vaginatum]